MPALPAKLLSLQTGGEFAVLTSGHERLCVLIDDQPVHFEPKLVSGGLP